MRIYLATWNIQKKPSKFFEATVEELLGLGGRRQERDEGQGRTGRARKEANNDDAMTFMLQEASEWTDFNKRKYKKAVYYNAEGSEAGILTVGMDPKNIIEVKGGRDWVGMVTKGVVYVSGHVVRTKKGQPDMERADRFFEETAGFINKAKEKNKMIKIVLGYDTNTTLRRGEGTGTGQNIMDPKQGHTQHSREQIHALMKEYNLSAPQTAGERKTKKSGRGIEAIINLRLITFYTVKGSRGR